MGGCVFPTLAEGFMSHYETIWLSNCPLDFKSVLYRRYVDDSLLLFRSESYIRLFLDNLNGRHPSIKFNYESERKGYLPFLNVNVRKTEHGFETSLFCKDTFTGLTRKYNSALSHRYKVNLIQCLWYRLFRIC